MNEPTVQLVGGFRLLHTNGETEQISQLSLPCCWPCCYGTRAAISAAKTSRKSCGLTKIPKPSVPACLRTLTERARCRQT